MLYNTLKQAYYKCRTAVKRGKVMNTTKNSITYKGYTIRLRRDSQTKRVNGAIILQLDQLVESLARAKRIINIIEG